ncbi:hypothetical protein NVP1233A_26 [Vibrio phage 1.233.A._10N.261.51.E6]|nr:hypothetical protein NVP1233A_26 [Vibrio phage 1.233.A._10N.261.51.E6]AUR96899.1 hypothetical protein NVP1233B_26 [Vibrio phage 1.233.B._10N.261.51.E6]
MSIKIQTTDLAVYEYFVESIVNDEPVVIAGSLYMVYSISSDVIDGSDVNLFTVCLSKVSENEH